MSFAWFGAGFSMLIMNTVDFNWWRKAFISQCFGERLELPGHQPSQSESVFKLLPTV